MKGGSGGGSATGTLERLRESGFQTDVKPAGRTRGGDERGRTWRSSELRCTIGRACAIARTERSARSAAATLHERVIATGGARDFPIRRVGADPDVPVRPRGPRGVRARRAEARRSRRRRDGRTTCEDRASRCAEPETSAEHLGVAATDPPRSLRAAARRSWSRFRGARRAPVFYPSARLPGARAPPQRAALDPVAEDEAFLRAGACSGRREQEAQARRGPLGPPALRSRLVRHLERQLPPRATAQGSRQELVLRVRRGERPGRHLPPGDLAPRRGSRPVRPPPRRPRATRPRRRHPSPHAVVQIWAPLTSSSRATFSPFAVEARCATTRRRTARTSSSSTW